MSLKLLIKNSLISIARPIAKRLGFVEKKIMYKANNKNQLIATVFNSLKHLGFNPKHIVDVGANHGTWSREVLNYFPDSHYTLIEPQHWLKDSFKDLLKSKKIQYFPIGVGKKSGTFKFTLHNRDDSSSFKYSEEEAKSLGYKQIEIEVNTLNNLLQNNSSFPEPDLIKIDAEGLDIEVLEGSSDYFGKTEVFIVEVGVANKSINNNVLAMLNFMDNKGYTLFDITDLNRPYSPKLLWLMELVFVRKGGFIDSVGVKK